MFKNFWVDSDNILDIIKRAWMSFINGDPIYLLSKKLKVVKNALINHSWDTSFALLYLEGTRPYLVLSKQRSKESWANF